MRTTLQCDLDLLIDMIRKRSVTTSMPPLAARFLVLLGRNLPARRSTKGRRLAMGLALPMFRFLPQFFLLPSQLLLLPLQLLDLLAQSGNFLFLLTHLLPQSSLWTHPL